jgi:hypothetical protein
VSILWPFLWVFGWWHQICDRVSEIEKRNNSGCVHLPFGQYLHLNVYSHLHVKKLLSLLDQMILNYTKGY